MNYYVKNQLLRTDANDAAGVFLNCGRNNRSAKSLLLYNF